MGTKKIAEQQLRSQVGKIQDRHGENLDWDIQQRDRRRFEEREKNFLRTYYGNLNSLFLKYVQHVSEVKTDTNAPFIVQVAPLVPASPNPLHFDVDRLRAAGVKAFHAAGYTVLENQCLIGINYKDLASEDSEIDAYRNKAKAYLDKKRDLETQLDPLTRNNQFIDDYEAEIHELLHGVNLDDDPSAVAARKTRVDNLQKQLVHLKKESDLLEKKYTPIINELAELMDEYKTFKTLKRPASVDNNFGKKLFETALRYVEILNEQLSGDDKLIFPETHGFLMNRKKSADLPSNIKRPKSVLHGNIAYFWVMKWRVFNIWSKLLADAEHNISGWSFPIHTKNKVQKKIEQDVKVSTDFTEELIRIKRFGTGKANAFKKMQVFLITQHKEMDDFYKAKFEKVWAEADEIVAQRKAEEEKQKNTKKANSLLE